MRDRYRRFSLLFLGLVVCALWITTTSMGFFRRHEDAIAENAQIWQERIDDIAHAQGALSAIVDLPSEGVDDVTVTDAANEVADLYLTLLQHASEADTGFSSAQKNQIDLLVVKGVDAGNSAAKQRSDARRQTEELRKIFLELTNVVGGNSGYGISAKRQSVRIGLSVAGLICTMMLAIAALQRKIDQPAPSPAGQPLDAAIFDEDSIDPGSGAVTRTTLELIMPREISRLKRYGHPLSLLWVTIDRFENLKVENRENATDYIVATIGEIIIANTRASDLFARLGENRFIVVLPETDQQGAMQAGEKIRRNIEVFPYDADNGCTVSIGAAEGAESDDTESIFDRAEKASAMAASAGGNSVSVSTKTV